LNGDFNFSDPIWQNISENAKDFLSKLLKVRPTDRSSSQEALNHPWITSQEIDIRSFHFQWRSKARDRREAVRKEKREQMFAIKTAERNKREIDEDEVSLQLLSAESPNENSISQRKQKSQSVMFSKGLRTLPASEPSSARAATPTVITTRGLDRNLRSERPDRIVRASDRLDRSGDRLDRSGDRSDRSGDRSDRSGDRLDRSGDRLDRSGDRSDRSGDRLDRSGDRLDRSSDRLTPDRMRASLTPTRPTITHSRASSYVSSSPSSPSSPSYRSSAVGYRSPAARTRTSGLNSSNSSHSVRSYR